MRAPPPTNDSPVTPSNHSPLITIAILFLMVTFFLSIVIRFAIRLGIARSLSRDDWTSFAAMLAGIAQSAAIIVAVHNGMGKFEEHLSSQQITVILKAQYVSDYFYSLALGLSKISILLLLHKLMPERLHKRLALGTCAFVALWTFATLLALALRCGAHLPWTIPQTDVPGQCMNLHTFWIANLPFDIISEIMMLALPVMMMIPVRVALSKKVVIVVAFAFRLLLIAVTAVRLIYVPDFLPSTNFTFRGVNFFILTQTTISVAITTSCIPCLKPFLDAFDSGQMGVKFKDGHPGSLSGSRTYPMRDIGFGNQLAYGKNTTVRSHVSAHGGQDEDEIVPAKRFGRRQHAPSIEKKPLPAVGRQVSTDDSNSITSEAKSDQMIIRKNTTWTVQYEDVDPEQSIETFPAQAHGSRSQLDSRSHLDDDSGEDEKARHRYRA